MNHRNYSTPSTPLRTRPTNLKHRLRGDPVLPWIGHGKSASDWSRDRTRARTRDLCLLTEPRGSGPASAGGGTTPSARTGSRTRTGPSGRPSLTQSRARGRDETLRAGLRVRPECGGQDRRLGPADTAATPRTAVTSPRPRGGRRVPSATGSRRGRRNGGQGPGHGSRCAWATSTTSCRDCPAGSTSPRSPRRPRGSWTSGATSPGRTFWTSTSRRCTRTS